MGKPSSTASRGCGISVVAIAVFVLTPIAFAWYVMRNTFRTHPEPLLTLKRLEEVTSVKLPPGSVLVDGTVCPCWNAYLYARVRIPPHEVPRFWNQPLFKGEVSATENPLLISLPIDVQRKWRLERVRDFRSSTGGDFDQEGASQALISLDDPSNPLLHLKWVRN